jgi:hypothetical protein
MLQKQSERITFPLSFVLLSQGMRHTWTNRTAILEWPSGAIRQGGCLDGYFPLRRKESEEKNSETFEHRNMKKRL